MLANSLPLFSYGPHSSFVSFILSLPPPPHPHVTETRKPGRLPFHSAWSERWCFNCHFLLRHSWHSSRDGGHNQGKWRKEERGKEKERYMYGNHPATKSGVWLWAVCLPLSLLSLTQLGQDLIWQAHCCHLEFVQFEILINELGATLCCCCSCCHVLRLLSVFRPICLLFVFL